LGRALLRKNYLKKVSFLGQQGKVENIKKRKKGWRERGSIYI